VNAAYTHNWNTAWKSTLWGSYFAQSYNSAANNMICDAGFGFNMGSAAIAIPGCNMDWNVWGAGLRTQWAVSSSFYIGLEVMYSKLETATTPLGLINLPLFSGKPATVGPVYVYNVADQDAWAVRLRVHRDFYP
jgi:Porin subfamily